MRVFFAFLTACLLIGLFFRYKQANLRIALLVAVCILTGILFYVFHQI